MTQPDPVLHVRGEAHFVADLPLPAGTLHAAVLGSPQAHAKMLQLDATAALNQSDVVAVLTAADIPGENQIGNIIQDEWLLAAGEACYIGQPVAVVIATTLEAARAARERIALELEPLAAVFDARDAFDQNRLIQPPRTFNIGDVEAAWSQCDVVIEGQTESGAQEHVYLETQGSLAIPRESGGVKVISATQSPGGIQRAVARVLGCPMHNVEVDVLRLGGAFGGKEEQATCWAAMAALAAWRLQRPVRLVLPRQEDIRMTGKRHPYSADFKLGLTRDGRILAYEVHFFQNAGAVADLSPAILERTLFHAANSYFIPNFRATAASCRTHLPPNTAFRGFGAPQAMFVLEAAIDQAAQRLSVEPAVIQEQNLLDEGDSFPYGMCVQRCRARRCWKEALQRYDLLAQRQRVRRFNAKHALQKKGLALMPICFGVSFTTTFLNQAQALVHVYADGSVGVSCSAVEMGQGVRQKIQWVAARTLGVALERIKLESTNTTRAANMSPTAASVGCDLNGQAVRTACLAILARLFGFLGRLLNENDDVFTLHDETVSRRGKSTDITWARLVRMAYLERVNLSAHAHYSIPNIGFDRNTEKGQPFSYHVFGTALLEATLDCLRGTYRIDTVRVVHDLGQSLAPLIDRGQVEGGIVQGLGWMMLEEIRHDDHGRLLTDNLTTYKIPDIYFAPEIHVHFLTDAENPAAVLSSKAVGEPPFMYGIGGYFAILQAMRAFRPDVDIAYDTPLTPEKVLLALYPEVLPTRHDAENQSHGKLCDPPNES